MTVESKGSVSGISLNKKTVRSINSFNNGEPLRNANPGRLRDKERRLLHIRPSQGKEFIIENEDDELIQTWRKRVDEFVSKCSRRPQPQLPEGRQEQKWSRTKKIDKSTFTKGIITRLNEKWVHRYQNKTVMSNRTKIV